MMFRAAGIVYQIQFRSSKVAKTLDERTEKWQLGMFVCL